MHSQHCSILLGVELATCVKNEDMKRDNKINPWKCKDIGEFNACLHVNNQ